MYIHIIGYFITYRNIQHRKAVESETRGKEGKDESETRRRKESSEARRAEQLRLEYTSIENKFRKTRKSHNLSLSLPKVQDGVKERQALIQIFILIFLEE